MRRSSCPVCKREFIISDGEKTYFPFCSRRCQEADLGRWFNEAYGAPVETERVIQEHLWEIEGEEGLERQG